MRLRARSWPGVQKFWNNSQSQRSKDFFSRKGAERIVLGIKDQKIQNGNVIDDFRLDVSGPMVNVANASLENLLRITHQANHTAFMIKNAILSITSYYCLDYGRHPLYVCTWYLPTLDILNLHHRRLLKNNNRISVVIPNMPYIFSSYFKMK